MRELASIHKMGFRFLKMIHREDSAIITLHLLELCRSEERRVGKECSKACWSRWSPDH